MSNRVNAITNHRTGMIPCVKIASVKKGSLQNINALPNDTSVPRLPQARLVSRCLRSRRLNLLSGHGDGPLFGWIVRMAPHNNIELQNHR